MRSGLVVSSVVRRCVFAFGFVSLLVPAGLKAQATAPAVALGSAAIGSPVSGTVTFTFTGSTAVGSISVVTQGATGLDFTLNTASPGSCVAQTYTTGTCTVGVTFTPQAAGLRMGAVLLLDGSSNKLAVASVSGSGSGATFATDSLVKASILANEYPSVIVVDASGNIYVSQVNTNAYKVTPAGVVSSIIGSAKYPGTLAVDGAGYIYILDNFNYTIYRTDPVSGAQVVLVGGLTSGYGMAIDPQGNLYVSQPSSTTILEYSPSGTLLATINTGVSSQAMVFDAAGNLYFAGSLGNVYVIAAGGTTSALVATVSNATGLGALAIDAAGNLYCANQSTTLYEIPAGTHTANAIITVASGTFINGVAIDGAGNLYYGNTNLYKVDRTHPTATLTGTTAIGSTATEQTVSLRNFGSAASAITGLVASANGKVGPSNTCSATTPVAIGATCVASLQFAPVASGSPQNATLNLTGPLTAPVFMLTGYVTGDPVQLGFGVAPAATLISGNSLGTVTVAVQDHAGTTVPAQTDSLTLTITGPTTPAPLTVAAVNGVATFNLSATTLTTVGTYTYAVTDNTRALTGTATTQVVLPKYFTVVPANLTITASAADSIGVKAYDNAGNLATGYAGYVMLSSTDAAATLPVAFALASGQGSANVTFNTAGNQTVTATDTVNGLVTGTSATIVVQPLPVYTVTVTSDPATGTAGNCTNQALSGATADVSCALRDAVAAVNALAITGTTGVQPVINFATGISGHTITVTAALVLTANASLVGPGPASLVTISGGGTTRILMQNTASTATSISGLTLSNGFALLGSAFYGGVASTYTFTNDVFSNNGYTGGGTMYGGALYLTAVPTVVVAGCSFVNNKLISSSGGSAEGGAIYQAGGSLTIRNSPQSNTVFSGNLVQATQSAYGGALYAASLSSGGLTISGASFLGNTAKSSATATYFTYGGAAYIQSTNTNSVVSIANSLFSGNTAASQYTTYGGALYFQSGAVTTTGSTFTGNTATFNTAINSVARYGGAIYSTVATTLYNDTITGNSVQGSNGRGGGVYALTTSTAYNTVISGNTASSSYVDVFAVSSGSNNYIDTSTSNSCIGNCAPLLSALGNYGGPVQTMVPLPGSPLLAAGLASKVNAAATDGRGTTYPRMINGLVDIGATEANYSLSFVTQPTTTGVNAALLPPPTVQLYESGVPFTAGAGQTLSVVDQSGAMFTDATDSTAYTSVAITASGLESLTPYILYPQTADALTVSVQSGASTPVTVASTTSANFLVANPSLAFVVMPPTKLTVGANAGVVTVALTNPGGARNTSVAPTVVTIALNGTNYTASTVNGVATFDFSKLNGGGPVVLPVGSYSYVASSSSYTTDTVSAFETVNGYSIWVLNGDGSEAKGTSAGVFPSTPTVYQVSGTTRYGGVVFDNAGSVYSVNTAANVVLSSTNAGGSYTTYAASGLNMPNALAMDGAGYLWITNLGNNTLSEVKGSSSTKSPAAGYGTSDALSGPSAIALDATGGVWVTNKTGNSVTHIFGAATPVVTPLASAVANGTLGVKP